ncbi:MAG: restriction endonuclease subunit S [Aeromonas sp.]|uniref:restriction endonuclease subunit S n=1 Tax=Aeromonas sp. QDB68 TaxID=2989823 RepID=UPI0022E11B67|nr:restriction endonuclease subunit S [Aeromonas sp. QDB68]MDU7311514.1 restriction endonuclease subunit S [Aeromonas sp.]
MSQLPKGWVETNFEDVSDYIQRGKGPKYAEFSEYPVVNQKAVRWFGIQEEHLKYVHPEQWDKWDEQRYIREGDILWNSTGTGTIGRACHIDQTQLSKAKVVDSHITIVRTNKLVESRFAFYWIMHPEIQGNINGLYSGSTNQVELSKKIVESTRFPLAPLAEQTCIVKKLDEVLAKVEATQARLARIPDIIKQFRQSVLAAAVSGKLTEEWRKPCPYQSINKDLTAPSCWSKCYLGEIVNYVTSGSRGWAKYYSTNGSLFIRSQDISADKLIIEDAAFVDLPAKAEGTRTKVESFDLLVTITGANVTKCALVEVDLDDAYVSQHVALIRLADSSNAKFLDLVLKAPNAGRKQLTSMAYGGGKPGLNLQNIKDVTFALPSQEEQTEIVRRVEQLFAYADTIEQQAKAAKERVDNLTQAILAKAFRGELTADWRAANPDLISGDNSAAALLARIQAERATTKPRKRATKTSAV